MYKTDVCIVGAGPGGCSTALFLAKAGVSCLLVDKARFPRDKVCGDGLSGWSVAMLNKIDPEVTKQFAQSSISLGSWGARFTAPNQQVLDVPFKLQHHKNAEPPGYTCTRFDFDNYLMDLCKSKEEITVVEQVAIEHFEQLNENTVLLADKNKQVQITTKLVIFANGAHSLQAKKLAGIVPEKKHYVAGVRAYFEGVQGIHTGNFIELHFLKEFLPGYFWIFPLPNGKANVGVGMRSDKISKKKVNLKDELMNCIQENEVFKQRFQHAKMLGNIQGFGLPLGSKKRPISGNNFMLVGDAASLIDPFTGEGIGNAMASGMLAAQQAQKALLANCFNASFMKAYDNSIYIKLWKELRLSKTMQDLLNYPWLFSLIVNKATSNKTLRETISCMLTDLDVRQQLKKPSFYLKVLFG